MLRPFILNIGAACAVALEKIGFERRSGKLVTDVNDDVIGRCSLNRIVHRAKREIRINPIVAVTHLPLENALAELEGRPRRRRYFARAAILRSIGYLTPQKKYTTWRFSEESDLHATARDLAKTVAEYGLPFIKEHRALKDFYESMVTRRYGGIAHDFAYRLPVAAMMLGMPDVARKHIEDYLKRLGGEAHSVAEDYRRFAERISQRLPEKEGNVLREAIERWRSLPPETIIRSEDAAAWLSEEMEQVARSNDMGVEWDASTATWSLSSDDAGITRKIDVSVRSDPARVNIAPYAFRDDAETLTRYYFGGPARAYGLYFPINPSQFRDVVARVVNLALSLTDADLKETVPLGL